MFWLPFSRRLHSRWPRTLGLRRRLPLSVGHGLGQRPGDEGSIKLRPRLPARRPALRLYPMADHAAELLP